MEKKFYVEKDFNPNHLQLLSIVEEWKASKDRKKLIELRDYYRAKNPTILKKPIGDREYNSRIISGYPKYIVTLSNGYFLGAEEPISYNFREDNGDEIKSINRYNDANFVNQELGKNMAIYGHALEQIYVDSDGKFRFKSVDPINAIPLFNDDIEEELNSVIKFKEDTIYNEEGKEVTSTRIEFYSKLPYREYRYLDGNLISNEEDNINMIGDVPFIFYENPDCMGDFEGVLTLIDAYDEALANNSNLFKYFNDAYMVAKGVDMGDLDIKDKKILEIPSDGDIQYLSKPQVTQDLINYMEVLRKDIHKYSNCVDISDKDFLNAASGIAMKLKLQGLEFLTGIKEASFRKGLTRRLELMSNFLNLTNKGFNFEDILIKFNRNTIDNLKEILDSVLMLKDIVSKETLLELIPIVDETTEVNRLNKEKEESQLEFNLINTNNIVNDENYSNINKEENINEQ